MVVCSADEQRDIYRVYQCGLPGTLYWVGRRESWALGAAQETRDYSHFVAMGCPGGMFGSPGITFEKLHFFPSLPVLLQSSPVHSSQDGNHWW